MKAREKCLRKWNTMPEKPEWTVGARGATELFTSAGRVGRMLAGAQYAPRSSTVLRIVGTWTWDFGLIVAGTTQRTNAGSSSIIVAQRLPVLLSAFVILYLVLFILSFP